MRQMITGLTMCAALGVLAPTGDAKAPQTSTTPATVVFRDAGSDRIRSDGGAYVHGGQRGLEVQMWTCATCSQDLTIGTFRSGRAIQFNYAPATDVTQPADNPPTGMLLDNAFVNIATIAALAPGQSRLAWASFNTDVGYFRWLGSQTGSSFGSQTVLVTRSLADPSIWTVTTPVPAVASGGYTAGDLSVLLRAGPRNTLTPVGLYHMAFAMTVSCPLCP